MKQNILFAILFLPFIYALSIEMMWICRFRKRLIHIFSLIFALSLLVCSIYIYINEFQFAFLSSKSRLSYEFKIDRYSTAFILLTSFIILLCIVESIVARVIHLSHYFFLFFILQGILNLFFCANGILLFYILFEFALIPVFFIIGLWGGKDKIKASIKFFLYTFAGSLGMLLAVLYMNSISIKEIGYGLNIDAIQVLVANLPKESRSLIWLVIFIAFAVKIPAFPLHTWLPTAHVQAPTAGSMILAGILLKMGGYGIFRILINGFGELSAQYSSLMIVLGMISIIYASFVAFSQKDVKSMIAYSSIAHMGFVIIGLFSGSANGVNGAIFQMCSHGIISAALFAMVGMFYRRTGNMELGAYSGLASKMPAFAIYFVILSMASMAVPGTSGFVGEVMIISGLISEKHLLYGAILSFSIVLSAMYMLKLLKNVVWGQNCDSTLSDLCFYEQFMLIVTVSVILYLGLYSSILLDRLPQV